MRADEQEQRLREIQESLVESGVRILLRRDRRRSRLGQPRGAARPDDGQLQLVWKGPRGCHGGAGGLRAGFTVRHERFERDGHTQAHLYIEVTPSPPANKEFYTCSPEAHPPHPDRLTDSWDDWDGDKQVGLGRIVELFGGM